MAADMSPQLGKPIEGTAHRDAIHVAVFPAVCDDGIKGGRTLKIIGERRGTCYVVRPAPTDTEGDWDAIADPFFEIWIKAGTPFWGLLRPGSVTGLRHTYYHPAFKAVPPRPPLTDRQLAQGQVIELERLLEAGDDPVMVPQLRYQLEEARRKAEAP
jgi:hypothetical protein